MDVTLNALSVEQPMGKALAVTSVAEPGTVNWRSNKPDRGGAPALTPRLAEIIAAMVDAVLDADTSGSSAIRGRVRTARCRQRVPGAAMGPFGGR
jgi:hypothetical protein